MNFLLKFSNKCGILLRVVMLENKNGYVSTILASKTTYNINFKHGNLFYKYSSYGLAMIISEYQKSLTKSSTIDSKNERISR